MSRTGFRRWRSVVTVAAAAVALTAAGPLPRQIDGTPTWHVEAVPGTGSGPHL